MGMPLNKRSYNPTECEQRLVDIDTLAGPLLLGRVIGAGLANVLRPGEVHQVQLPNLDQLLTFRAVFLHVNDDREDGVRAAAEQNINYNLYDNSAKSVS